MKRTSLSVFVAAALTARSLLAATDVPVKQIVLFSSGVGYFEHDGPIKDNDSTQLHFKAGQINDILKSLVLQDTGNGKIGEITYPSQDPVDRALKSFEIDITSNPTFSQLLTQLRGAKVSLVSQTEKISGTILGVETKRKPVEKGEPIEVQVLNLVSGASIRAIELNSINGLSLDDPQLQDELNKALATLAQSRDKDKKPVTINFQGQGERTVRIGYVVETPIWKTSYRLILPDDEKAKPRLQGWAIIENQTDNDWNNVNLSLVSGRPISFVMNLYSPLYIPRPVVTPELYASLRPQTYAEGLADEVAAEAAAPAPMATPGLANQMAANRALRQELRARGGQAGGFGGASNGAMAMQSMAKSSMDADASVSTVANATNLGDLFQYNIGSVSLARQSSAMLPIVTDDIEAERVSIYNPSVMPRNPLTGARLKNITGKSLLQGPITVLDKGVYAGDARIEDLPPGQQRLLSYGIDLQTTVDTPHNKTDVDVLGGKIVKGVLEISRKSTSSIEYIAENKSDLDKTVILEQPIQGGWDLIDSPKPEEQTPSLYRFRLPVAKHAKAKMTVKTQNVSTEQLAILPADFDGLIYWTNHGAMSKEVREALTKAIQMRQAVVEFDRQIDAASKRIDAISNEQGRIRSDMNTVDHNSQYFQRLLNKLNDQESQIEKLQTDRETATQKRDEARKQMEDYVNDLNIG